MPGRTGRTGRSGRGQVGAGGGGGGGGLAGNLWGSVFDDNVYSTEVKPNEYFGMEPGDVPYDMPVDPTELTSQEFVGTGGKVTGKSKKYTGSYRTENKLAADENARELELQTNLRKMLGSANVSDATAMLPLEAQRALASFYAAQGANPTPENVAAANEAVLFGNRGKAQGLREAVDVANATYDDRLSAARADAARQAAIAQVLSSGVQDPATRNAILTGQRGQALLPAGQATQLFRQTLSPGSVSLTDQAGALGVSPFSMGAEPRETPIMNNIPGVGQMFSGQTTKNLVYHPPRLSQADVDAAQAAVGNVAPPNVGVPAAVAAPLQVRAQQLGATAGRPQPAAGNSTPGVAALDYLFGLGGTPDQQIFPADKEFQDILRKIQEQRRSKAPTR